MRSAFGKSMASHSRNINAAGARSTMSRCSLLIGAMTKPIRSRSGNGRGDIKRRILALIVSDVAAILSDIAPVYVSNSGVRPTN